MNTVIISGICGKMGKQVYENLRRNNVNVVCGIDSNPRGDFDCPVYSSFDDVKEYADVIIDFSSHEQSGQMLQFAVATKIPLFIGTTGQSVAEAKEIERASHFIPILKMSNTSLSVNLIIKIAAKIASILNDYDIEIIEKHHKYKSDAPSGTAISIFNEIKKVKQNTTLQLNRNGNPNRQNEEITIHSVRGGNEIGEHEICFYGNFDTIKLTHKSNSKELFADWGVKGADYISKQKKGLYTEENFFSEIFD